MDRVHNTPGNGKSFRRQAHTLTCKPLLGGDDYGKALQKTGGGGKKKNASSLNPEALWDRPKDVKGDGAWVRRIFQEKSFNSDVTAGRVGEGSLGGLAGRTRGVV